MKKKKIIVFHTGGTISMKKDDSGVDVHGGNALVAGMAELMDIFLLKHPAELIHKQIFEIASPQMTEGHMFELRQAILEVIGKVDGVVVTHGTDTLEETSYFLDITVPHTIPIATIGAQRSFDEVSSDAMRNFQCAVLTAMCDEAKDMGTMIVVNEEIHAARSVTKSHTSNVATFESPGFGYIGIITANDQVFFGRKLKSAPCYDIRGMSKKVMLIKIFGGIDSTVFDAFEALAEKNNKYPFDGLVIEALGVGNVPARIVPCLQKVESRGIPIVLTSRCVSGIPQFIYGYSGGGKSLKTKEVKSIIFSHGLNGPKARLKLAVLLENSLSHAEIEAEFAKAV